MMRSIERRHITEDFNIWPSFTDMITGIFLFLIFIFIILIIQQFFYTVRLTKLERYLGKFEKDMAELEREFGKQTGISFDVAQGRIVLQEQILFDFGKSDIKPDSQRKLQKLGESLKAMLDRQSNRLAISIDGHTDSVGSYEFNMKLGSDRAIAILDFLKKNAGIDPGNYDISANTYGEYKSVKPYEDEKEEIQNRRIEIRIIPKFDELLRMLKGK